MNNRDEVPNHAKGYKSESIYSKAPTPSAFGKIMKCCLSVAKISVGQSTGVASLALSPSMGTIMIGKNS